MLLPREWTFGMDGCHAVGAKGMGSVVYMSKLLVEVYLRVLAVCVFRRFEADFLGVNQRSQCQRQLSTYTSMSIGCMGDCIQGNLGRPSDPPT